MEFVAANYPEGPGVYLMKDVSGRIIYVGKAVSLRRRLSSYFRSKGHSPKTAAMVSHIAHIDVLRVTTEKEALLLEESLIKKNRPRYNIVLRDDKRYLLFRLDKRSDYPRLSVTRRVAHDGSAYFGPFSSAAAARDTLKLAGAIFPLRKCGDRVFGNRVRPCLYHQLGQCLAPCVLPVDRERYAEIVAQVEQFLSGRSQGLVRRLRRRMDAAAAALQYERAAVLRDQIRAIEQTLETQASVLVGDTRDRDVLAVAEAEAGLGLGLLFVRGGRLLDQKAVHWPGLHMDDAAEALETFLTQYYSAGRYIPGRIVVSHPPEGEALSDVFSERRGAEVRLSGPRGPEERRLMEMAAKVAASAEPADAGPDVAAELARTLGLGGPPQRIEGVDISHLAGRGVRAGLVVFEAGAPLKSDYRTYALPAAEGTGDDYLSLAQWAGRRVKSGPPWPDLLLIDGGRGQLAAVRQALKEAGADFPCAAIAKGPSRRAGELEDRIFLPGRKNPAALRPGGPGLLFLQRVRDEAHRYVIGRGRAAARRLSLTGGLDALPGVGRKTARLLFEHFGDMAAIRTAGVAELAALPGLGPKSAAKLRAALDALPGPRRTAEEGDGVADGGVRPR